MEIYLTLIEVFAAAAYPDLLFNKSHSIDEVISTTRTKVTSIENIYLGSEIKFHFFNNSNTYFPNLPAFF